MIFLLGQAAESVDQVVKVIDRASAAGDRWLFIAILVLLLIFAACVIYWLVRHIEKKDARIESKERESEEKLAKIADAAKTERGEERKEFLTALDAHKSEMSALTVQVKSLTEIVTAHDRDMRDAHRMETSVLIRTELLRMGIVPELAKQPVG